MKPNQIRSHRSSNGGLKQAGKTPTKSPPAGRTFAVFTEAVTIFRAKQPVALGPEFAEALAFQSALVNYLDDTADKGEPDQAEFVRGVKAMARTIASGLTNRPAVPVAAPLIPPAGTATITFQDVNTGAVETVKLPVDVIVPIAEAAFMRGLSFAEYVQHIMCDAREGAAIRPDFDLENAMAQNRALNYLMEYRLQEEDRPSDNIMRGIIGLNWETSKRLARAARGAFKRQAA